MAVAVEAAVAGEPTLASVGDCALPHAVEHWIAEVPAAEDPRLGRPGAICPALPDLLKAGGLFWARVSLAEALRSPTSPVDAVSTVIERLLVEAWGLIRSRPGELTACLWVIEGVPAHVMRPVLETAFMSRRAQAVGMSLMIGFFHPFRQRQSLALPGVATMRSPEPLLAVRPVLRSDERSLHGETAALASFHDIFPPPASRESDVTYHQRRGAAL